LNFERLTPLRDPSAGIAAMKEETLIRFAIAASVLICALGCDQQPRADVPHNTIDTAKSSGGVASSEHPRLSPDPSDLVVAGADKPAQEPPLEAQRTQLDKTVWNNEVLAQQYERALVRLWDELLGQDQTKDGDPFAVLNAVRFESMLLPQLSPVQDLEHNITLMKPALEAREMTHDQWRQMLDRLHGDGYRVVQSEWHHAEFDAESAGAARSTIAMALYAANQDDTERVVIRGNLKVQWQKERDAEGIPVPRSIDASDIELLRRRGKPLFQEILTLDRTRPESRSGVQPVIVYDLDQDGLAEIIAAGSNTVYWNRGNGQFRDALLCAFPNRTFEVGLVADLTGDAVADYVAPGIRGDLLLYQGAAGGSFPGEPVGKARGGGPLTQPQVITAGDVDNDGDLDLWIAQYKISYIGGQMPTPYYDANDGFPAFLLLNDGTGRFNPATEEAGLAAKRHRRTYGSSFVDLDEDGDLDLLVVSDFAGIDIHLNDGSGYFTDVTDRLVDERHLFGMSVTFADFNRDGRLDFYVTGMSSTTARRLEYMKLGRNDRPDIHLMRPRMAYGNRMYLAGQDGFAEPAFRDQVARTGWAWGATSFDFDNDGDQDIFVANGHASGKSTKDHCTHFWCHDIYDASSSPSAELSRLFADVMAGYFDRSESWDGYQKNVLLMNRSGKAFENVAFLMGVGHEYDGRAAVSEDLDGDGRVDLVVVEDRWHDGQILHVYQNQIQTEHHWIGVRLREEGPGMSPVGAKITVTTDQGTLVDQIVTGDSIHAQHSNTVHFGLGSTDCVQSIEVRWPGGRVRTIDRPACDTYHFVRAKE
jgi:hypothetical protein